MTDTANIEVLRDFSRKNGLERFALMCDRALKGEERAVQELEWVVWMINDISDLQEIDPSGTYTRFLAEGVIGFGPDSKKEELLSILRAITTEPS
jgi:hypothetical protein